MTTRILIAGVPRAGKTTLSALAAHELGVVARHTDDLIGQLEWSEASAEVSTWIDDPGPWVIEGVSVPRALRKWCLRNPDGKPCDIVVWLSEPFLELNEGQERMATGCATVWRQVLPELVGRGVTILEGSKVSEKLAQALRGGV